MRMELFTKYIPTLCCNPLKEGHTTCRKPVMIRKKPSLKGEYVAGSYFSHSLNVITLSQTKSMTLQTKLIVKMALPPKHWHIKKNRIITSSFL
jgi:hypothetical protein